MIKGKFYTGLTSEMMGRSRTVNRQQTHFFWPDETDAESVAPRSKKTVSKPALAPVNNINNDDQSDIKPRELFRKQLSSGIQFYDNVNAKTPEARRRRIKKIDNINLNNNDTDFQPEKKKLETFSSKIEFYDFEHENQAKNENAIKASSKPKPTIDIVRNDELKTKNDNTDVTKKRISFQTNDKSSEKTKGILKNSDEKSTNDNVSAKPLAKRGLLPKNLSKSVENISKLAKSIDDSESKAATKPANLSTIIKEVKSLNLSKERTNTFDSYDREIPSKDRIPNGVAERKDIQRNSREKSGHYTDSIGYRDDEYRNRNDSYRPHNRYDDDRGDRDYYERRYERSQRSYYSQPREIYEYREPPRRFEERSRRSPPRYDYDRYDNDREFEPRRSPIKDSKPRIDRYDEVSRNRDPYDEYTPKITTKPKHIPQHLQTNIHFNGKVLPQTQRPMSVRNSAVTRVGVGLPDYE